MHQQKTIKYEHMSEVKIIFQLHTHLTIPEEALPMVVSFGLMNFM